MASKPMSRMSRCTRLRLTSSPWLVSHTVIRRLPKNGWAVYSSSMSRISRKFSGVSPAGSSYRLDRFSPSSSHWRRTLKSGRPASIKGRSRSAEDGSFFFDPFQLHFEPADLLEQLRLAGLGVGRAGLGPVGEHRPGPGQQLLLPAVDQGRVDPEVAGQFVDGAVALDRRQGDL